MEVRSDRCLVLREIGDRVLWMVKRAIGCDERKGERILGDNGRSLFDLREKAIKFYW